MHNSYMYMRYIRVLYNRVIMIYDLFSTIFSKKTNKHTPQFWRFCVPIDQNVGIPISKHRLQNLNASYIQVQRCLHTNNPLIFHLHYCKNCQKHVYKLSATRKIHAYNQRRKLHTKNNNTKFLLKYVYHHKNKNL